MSIKKKRIVIWVVSMVMLIGTVIWVVWANSALEVNTYTISSDRIPEEFSGYRIAHVSDLHNQEMGENNETLLSILKDAKPDMIAITGDIIDSRSTDVEIALSFAKEAVKIAPCYYVTGNHESRVSEYDDLMEGLEACGVVVLDDSRVEIEKDGAHIVLCGLQDPSFQTDYLLGDSKSIADAKLQYMLEEEMEYTILLSHRPELFDTYVKNKVDLVLSGHAHGGQFRLPIIGGLVAPNQGFFPKYDAGLFAEKDTNMIISKGVGNSIIPIRVNNRPEVIIVELKSS